MYNPNFSHVIVSGVGMPGVVISGDKADKTSVSELITISLVQQPVWQRHMLYLERMAWKRESQAIPALYRQAARVSCPRLRAWLENISAGRA